jgi:hypothetical protein
LRPGGKMGDISQGVEAISSKDTLCSSVGYG